MKLFHQFTIFYGTNILIIFHNFIESIEGVNKIKDGYNPSTWMLEVTSAVQEQMNGISFSEAHKNSKLYG
jgi:hypothetical protein